MRACVSEAFIHNTTFSVAYLKPGALLDHLLSIKMGFAADLVA